MRAAVLRALLPATAAASGGCGDFGGIQSSVPLVCCAAACGAHCGGSGCGGDCCTGHISGNGKVCGVGGATAPCTLPAQPPPPPPGCADFGGIQSGMPFVCCAAACAPCGGSGCKGDSCCTGHISTNGKVCGVDHAIAPCTLPGGPPAPPTPPPGPPPPPPGSAAFCSLGPHHYNTTVEGCNCVGQCAFRKANKQECAQATGSGPNDKGCYCSTVDLPAVGPKCAHHGSYSTCTPSDYCPSHKTGGTCATAALKPAAVSTCNDCYAECGYHVLHYACYKPSTKECHCTESECTQKEGLLGDPPCGNVPGYCPCDTAGGWERCK